jgi:hypothetical protein
VLVVSEPIGKKSCTAKICSNDNEPLLGHD